MQNHNPEMFGPNAGPPPDPGREARWREEMIRHDAVMVEPGERAVAKRLGLAWTADDPDGRPD
jgi:hypothetical protein